MAHKLILLVADEAMNHVIVIPLYLYKSTVIHKAFITHVVGKYKVPEYLIFHGDVAFLSIIMKYIY